MNVKLKTHNEFISQCESECEFQSQRFSSVNLKLLECLCRLRVPIGVSVSENEPLAPSHQSCPEPQEQTGFVKGYKSGGRGTV